MSNINLQNIITRNNQITAAAMDGEIVMMNIKTGNYYNLGKTGSVIWNILEHPLTVEELIGTLIEKYNVTREQCETDTLIFLQELSKEGLIIIE